MSIQVLSHKLVKPDSLKFPAKWRSHLDEDHVANLARQIIAGQELEITANKAGWVLKGRHSSAAYMLVRDGSKKLGIPAHPRIKAPVKFIAGTKEDEELLELSSIVNQRKATSDEAGPAYKRIVAILAEQAVAAGAPKTKQALVEEAAKLTGKSPRTIAKGIRHATPEKERKPSTPRKKKTKIVNAATGEVFDAEKDAFVPPLPEEEPLVMVEVPPPDSNPPPPAEPTSTNPAAIASHKLALCLDLLERLRANLAETANDVFAVADMEASDRETIADQLIKDQSVLEDIVSEYRQFAATIEKYVGAF